MDLKEEKELVERAKKDKEAFGEIYDHYYSPIFNYSLKRTANVKVAQDVTSEVFFKALKNLWKFHWQSVSLSSWLYRIASNEINDYFRKNKKYVSLEMMLESGDFDPAGSFDVHQECIDAQDKLEKHKDFLKAQKIISCLPDKYQEVLVLKYFEKMKIREISEIMGMSEGTVKSLLHRGLKKVRVDMSRNFSEI